MAPNRRSLCARVLCVFVLVLFLPTLAEIWQTWSTHRYAAHGMFVPLLSGLILWTRRRGWLGESAHNRGAALAVLGIALALAAVGHANQNVFAHVVAVVVAVTALALWGRGVEWTRRRAAPILFLLFMLPLPRDLVALVTLPLQHFIARLSSSLLELANVAVVQDGLRLDLASAHLHVDEQCNGLRFLMVVLIVATAFALMHLPSRGQWLMISVAVLAAVLANVVRVAAIGAAVAWVGPEAATGIYHDSIGRAVWVLSLAAILGFGIVLGRSERPGNAGLARAKAQPALK
jgi:exosortase